MDREYIITACHDGILSEDTFTTDLENGVIIRRYTEIRYEGVEGSEDPEEVTEVIEHKLLVIFQDEVIHEITLTEGEQDYLQGMIDVILEPGYKEYRANRQLYKVGYFY